MASEIKGLKELVEPGHASRSALGWYFKFQALLQTFQNNPLSG